MNTNFNPQSYVYLTLEPNHLARFNRETLIVEAYNQNTGNWKTETNSRLIKRFNQDSAQISYEEFLKLVNKSS